MKLLPVESGVLIQAETEGPELVAMRQSWGIEEGCFVSTTIGNLPVTFLVDTGSNVSILRKGMLEQFSSQTGLPVQPTNIK